MTRLGGKGHFDGILTSDGARNVTRNELNVTISTGTPQTTNPQTSPSFADDATCATTANSKQLIASPKLWLPDSIKPYYQDESVLIIHGDCRAILPSLPDVDLVLTDPPYGIG